MQLKDTALSQNVIYNTPAAALIKTFQVTKLLDVLLTRFNSVSCTYTAWITRISALFLHHTTYTYELTSVSRMD